MTLKIASKPSAGAEAAAASRSRFAPDASADPFSLHLENATEQASALRGKDKPASPPAKVDAGTRSATPKPRKDAVKSNDEASSDSKAEAKPEQDDTDTSLKTEHDEPADDDADAKKTTDADQDQQPAETTISVEAIENAALANQPALVTNAPDLKIQQQAAADAATKIVPQETPVKPAPQPNLPRAPKAGDDDDASPRPVFEKHLRPQPKPATKEESQLSDDKNADKGATQKPVAAAVKPDAAAPEVAPAAAQAPRQQQSHTDHSAEKSHSGNDPVDRPASAIQAYATAATLTPGDASAALAEKPLIEKSDDDNGGSPRTAAPALFGVPAQPNASAAQSADSARAAQDSPRTSHENTFDQIVLGLRTKMDAANQKAQIELNPPNLGKLHVSIEVSNGLLTAQFRAGSDVVRDLLSSHMDHLRSVLEGQGIAVDKLAVSSTPTSGDSGSSAGNSTNPNHDGRSGGAFSQERQASRQSSGDTFSKLWRAAREKEEPIDLLA